MNLELFALCDAATVSGGKLNVLGAFDSICATQFPVNHAQCTIVVRVRFNRVEEGDHRLKINIMDEDGRPVMAGLDGNMGVKFGPDDESAVANLLINLQQFKIDRAGAYGIDVAIDGRHLGSIPLYVKQTNVLPTNT